MKGASKMASEVVKTPSGAKRRGKRMTCASRIILSVSVPSQYLVTLRSSEPLTDDAISKLVCTGNTLHAVAVACKAAGVAVAFNDMGTDTSAKNSWVRAKVVKA